MIRRRRARSRRGWRAWLKFAAVVVLALFAVFCGYSFGETYRIEVTEYSFSSPDLPAAFDGTQVVLLNDIHRSLFFSQKRLAHVVDQVQALDPDLIALGGDYVWGDQDLEGPVFAELGRLKAPLGVYGVLGNHDYTDRGDGVKDPAPTIEAAAAAGIPLLHNAGAWIQKSGQRIRLIGVADLQEGLPLIANGLVGIDEGEFVILLSHEPDYAEYFPRNTAALTLCGHTHGGQITFFGRWAPLVASHYGQKYRTGMVDNGATTVVVSNGVGFIPPPLRFFARPQIVVVTLHRAP